MFCCSLFSKPYCHHSVSSSFAVGHLKVWMLTTFFLQMDLFGIHCLHCFFFFLLWFCLIISELHFTFESFNLLFSLVNWFFRFEFSVQTQICFHVLIIWSFFISLKDLSFCESMVVDDIISYARGPSLTIYNLGFSCFLVCFFLSFFCHKVLLAAQWWVWYTM